MARENQNEKIALDKGLPCAVTEEKLVLGSILLDDSCYETIGASLKAEHFSLEVHQKIYRNIKELKDDGERADRITLANLLQRRNQLESIGGLSYLISLDDGIPKLPNLSGYVRIIRDKAALRDIIVTGQRMMNAALIGADSPDKIIQSAATTMNRIDADLVTAKTSWTLSDTIEEAGGLGAFLAPRTDGTPMGFPCLDAITYGLEPGLLYVIGGDSGQGKSSLAGNISANVSLGDTGTEWRSKPKPTGIFSLEMSKEELYLRMLCSRSKVSNHKLQKGRLEPEERRALQFSAMELSSAPIHIDDTAALGIHDFCDRVRRMKREHGIIQATLDNLQILDWRRDDLKSEYEGITYATRLFKQVAKEEKLAVVILTQFNQEYSRRKDKAIRPTLDACHGSSSIKKDADVAILLYRLSQAHPSTVEYRNVMEAIVAKHRSGKTGTVLLDWHGSYTTFIEKPESEQPGKEEN